MGELIAVLSGKGGTGKTSLTAGLATSLAHLGETVLCIDCDVGLRNLDIALGLAEEGALSFAEVYSGHYTLDKATSHPFFPGLKFLTAPIGCTAADIDEKAFGRLLKQARQEFSYIFLDAPAGIEAGFQKAARYADRIILVTNSDPASIRDASTAGNILEQMGKKNIRLIVNRIHKHTMETIGLTVDDIMDRAGLPLLGIVPEDVNILLAAAKNKPLIRASRGGAAAACRRIAKRITGQSVPIRL
ncbi:MAG: septum site-determining protein MinD [Ruminococcaceae bacterium]|nr:septum site-determining protein MinD [Oscillospiraceae bacterium]